MGQRAVTMALIAALGLMTSSGVSARRQSSGAARPSERTSDASQRQTLQLVCGSCHAVDVVSGLRPKMEWKELVETMKSYGAVASEEDFALVDSYLAQNLTVVQVNTAPADEFVPVLDVDVTVAEEIVKYRSEHDAFKSVDDLKKVPGLSAAKVDARKDRLRF